MCEAAKWVIVSRNDVSQDDSKLLFQTTGIHFCDCSGTSFFLICPEYVLSDKAGEKSTCVAKLKTLTGRFCILRISFSFGKCYYSI